jgi:DNA-binding XRE family transcriptional regulator
MKKESRKLREARIKAGLTIQGLADKAEVPWATVQAIEVGRLSGSLMTKMKLADALKIPFYDLISKAEAETFMAALSLWMAERRADPMIKKEESAEAIVFLDELFKVVSKSEAIIIMAGQPGFMNLLEIGKKHGFKFSFSK